MPLLNYQSDTALATATTVDEPAVGTTAHVVDRYWVRWLTRCTWLAVLCGLVGAISTYAWLTSQPPTYRSAALIQIEGKGPQPATGEDELDGGSPLGDEVFVVRGEQVLRRAIGLESLGGVAPFAGMPDAEIAAKLGGSTELVVEPAGSQVSTNVIRIQYDGPTPSSSQRVVRGILKSYLQLTQENYEKGDDESLSRILASREKALADLKEIEREHDAFLKRTELVFLDGVPQSVHRKIADRFLSQREELMIQRADIESRIRSAEINLNQSDPGVLMLSLKADTETSSDAINRNISRQLEQMQNELRDRASVRARETDLAPLEKERDKLLEKFGRRHPKVREVQAQIDVVSERIARLETEENEKEATIKKIMTLGGKPEVDIDPQAELRARVELAIKGLKQQLESLDRQLESVNTSYAEESTAAKAEVEAIRESQRFERDIARQQDLYEKVLARLDEVGVLSEDRGVVVTVLDSPREGVEVEQPMERQTLTGGLIGFVIGIVLALMLPPRQRDIPIHIQPSQGLTAPVLGHVPRIATTEYSQPSAGSLEHRTTQAKLCTVNAPYGGAAESYHAIRAALLSASAVRDDRIIHVTSFEPEVGRSTVTANLAVSSAREGKKVLLIDADLWRPKMQELFALTETRGLRWILESPATTESGNEIADQVMQTIQPGPSNNLSILTAGSSNENPSSLLTPTKIAHLYESLRDRFDLILVDTPPFDAVSTSRDLVSQADAVALVIGAGPDEHDQAAKATASLTRLNANVIGVIINGSLDGSYDQVGHQLYPAPRDLHLESKGHRGEGDNG